MKILTATADDLRNQMPRILAAVEAGSASYIITKHGRVVGQLIPAGDGGAGDDLLATGEPEGLFQTLWRRYSIPENQGERG